MLWNVYIVMWIHLKVQQMKEIWRQDYLDEVIRIYDNNGIKCHHIPNKLASVFLIRNQILS